VFAPLLPIESPQRLEPIIGGSEVAACGWPSVVALDGTCSGTLVHPNVVLYAAHCGPNVHFVTPGEIEADGTPVDAVCTVNPDWDHEAGGNDFAVCVLAEPIEGVPIVPILMGCEHQLLAPEALATSVGFGNAPDGPAGVKRAVTYAIDEVVLDEGDVWLGGADGSLCNGDSGGGAFVQWLDGSWRLFGVHSAVAGEPCTDGQAVVSLASGAVPWIEEYSGFDVTPCHDADGTWNPGPDCGEMPNDPAAGGGAWPSCESGPLGGASSACGAPSYGPDDLAAPTIAIVSPRDGAVFPLRDGTAEITMTIDASDEGWGIDRTWLRFEGEDVPSSEDVFPPWEVSVFALPEGVFTLEAVARDWAGNEGVAAVMIVVGDAPLPSESSSGAGADATSGDGDAQDESTSAASPDDAPTSDDSTSTDTPPVTGEFADGCGCGPGSERARDAWLFVLLVVVGCGVRRSLHAVDAVGRDAGDVPRGACHGASRRRPALHP